MPRMQHQVTLSPDDRDHLTGILRRGRASAYTQRRARVLLKTDRHGPRLPDTAVADACEVSVRLVARARAQWCADGRQSLDRTPRVTPGRQPLLDPAQETRVIAATCGAPPAGQARWSLRQLADRVVELEIVPAISHETVRQALKKTTSNRG